MTSAAQPATAVPPDTLKARAEHQFPLPSGLPFPNWHAQEIILVRWLIDPTVPRFWIDNGTNPYMSGRYDATYLANIGKSGYLLNISQFAYDVAHDSAPVPGAGLYPNLYPSTQFTIYHSCYIVFALEQPESPKWWQFWKGTDALTMGVTPYAKYTDLNHVLPDGSVVSHVSADGCVVAYFSAYVDEYTGSETNDGFTMDIQYWSGGSLHNYPFDPAIKNKGHNDGGPVPFIIT